MTCERDRDCGLALQAFSLQLRLLAVQLTNALSILVLSPTVLLFFTCCVCFLHHFVQTQNSLFFIFFDSSTVGLRCRVFMLQECVDSSSESLKFLSVPTDRQTQWQIHWGSFLLRKIYLQTETQKKNKNVQIFTHMFLNEQLMKTIG